MEQKTTRFDRFSDCVFVVYPAGTAGDLLASIIAQHFPNTNAKFLGIDNKGRVDFKSSDNKFANLFQNDYLKIIEGVNQSFINDNNIIKTNPMAIISCHYCSPKMVIGLLDYFTRCKIVRIYLDTPEESALAMWMSAYKNFDSQENSPLSNEISSDEEYLETNNKRLFQLPFKYIINSKKFDTYYNELMEFLNIKRPSVTKQFVETWFSKQHSYVQKQIGNLANAYEKRQ